jgi:hypothetical protein
LEEKLLARPAVCVFVAPLLYVPGAISGNRDLLAIVGGSWVVGQIACSLVLYLGDRNDSRRAVSWWAALGLISGLAPWLLLTQFWPRLSTTGIALIMPALAVFWVSVAVIGSGEGSTLRARVRTSPYREGAAVLAALFGFVAFIVGLVLLIKALRPLA